MQANESKLERTLGLFFLVLYGVGTILGLGIYVLLGKVVGEAGTLAPFAFLLASIIALFTGLSYGELAARIPKSAGEVNYVDRAFGLRSLSIVTGWMIIVSAIISTATVVRGYVGYVHVFIEIPDWIVIVSLSMILGGIATWGIKESVTVIAVITFIEIAGIVLIIAVAGDNLATLSSSWRDTIPRFDSTDWLHLGRAAFLAFFVFVGFEDLVNVAEEAKTPERDMPRSIVISLCLLAILYVIVTLIAVTGLGRSQLDASEAPLADILAEKGEHYPKVISLISLIAIINGVLVQIVMSARVLYGMAEKKMAPRVLGRVNRKTKTPVIATVGTTFSVMVLGLLFALENLAVATNYVLISVFVLVNLALINIKRKEPSPEGVTCYPMAIPVIGAITSLSILAFKAIDSLT